MDTVIEYLERVGSKMSLIRTARTLQSLTKEYQHGERDKKLRSYFLPKYQQDMIDILSTETGLSKAGVVRAIIDEWYELRAANAE